MSINAISPQIINPTFVPLSEFNALKSAYLDTVELLANALKRISQLETTLFKKDEDGEILRDMEDKPIVALTKATQKPQEEPKPEAPIIPSSTLELKAEALTTYLKEKVKPNWAGDIVLNASDFYDFMKKTISEKLRWKPDLRNMRQAKKEIFNKAVEMYPLILEIVKSGSGNKTTGIALKKSGKRSNTDACT